jgi:outer membrane protein OmpA-like peptidoglycan-associated protein
MPSIVILRAVAGATLGLGVADLVVLNAVLGPGALAGDPPPAVVAVATPPATPAPPAPPATVSVEPREERPAPHRDERIYFATMSAALGADALTALHEMVERASPTATFTLEGHADVRGAEGLNLSLSRSRATAVAAQLARLGVARARITVDFVGSANASPTGELWRDRRVDIRITDGGRR